MMQDKKPFNWEDYMSHLMEANKLAKSFQFSLTTCTGPGYLEGMLQQFRTVANFICITDTCEESTFQRSGGWFKRRAFVTFIIMRYNPRLRNDRNEKIATARELFRQFLSKMIQDSNGLDLDNHFLNVSDIRSKELGGSFLNSATGLFFTTYMDEPVNLCYDGNEWNG